MTKYTREVLEKAVAESNSIADVLRYLGLRLAGGTHAHISRKIKKLGIDTSEFTGQVHNRGKPSPKRLSPQERLVVMPQGSRRTPGQLLLRSLVELGHEEVCEGCGIGPVWNGLRLTLHIDHISGNFHDNRPENLRVLCPNCHSQTPTFGNRSRFTSRDIDENEVISLIRRVDHGELTATQATQKIGCSRLTFYRIRARLEAVGAVTPRTSIKSRQSSLHIDAVLAYTLSNPAHGARRIANALRTNAGLRISNSTVTAILRDASLGTRVERLSAVAHRGQMPTTGQDV